MRALGKKGVAGRGLWDSRALSRGRVQLTGEGCAHGSEGAAGGPEAGKSGAMNTALHTPRLLPSSAGRSWQLKFMLRQKSHKETQE